MLKLEEKQKLMVFRNETKEGNIFYTASFDSTIKVDSKNKTIYCGLPIKCSKETFSKLGKIFKNGAKYSVITANTWLCCFEVEIDGKNTTRPALFIQTIH